MRLLDGRYYLIKVGDGLEERIIEALLLYITSSVKGTLRNF